MSISAVNGIWLSSLSSVVWAAPPDKGEDAETLAPVDLSSDTPPSASESTAETPGNTTTPNATPDASATTGEANAPESTPSEEDADAGVTVADSTAAGEEAPESTEDDLALDAELAGMLEETVVASASRKAEASGAAPATTEVITASDLRRFGIRTLDEAFNYLSLGMTHGATGGTGQVGARGITIAADLGSHVLLLLDGHVVNEPGTGASFYDTLGGLPMEMIDRIEIVYGPGSVLYGNNAMLAVVSVITKKGKSVDGVQVIGEHAWSPNQNRFGNFTNYRPDRAGHRNRIGLLYGRGFRVGRYDGDVLVSGEYLADRGPKHQYGPQFIPGIEDLFDFGANTGSGDPRIWGGYTPATVRGPYGYLKFALGRFTFMARGAWLTKTSPEAALEFGTKNGFGNSNAHLEARYDYQIKKKVSGLARVYGDYYGFRNELDFPGQTFCGAITAPCTFHVAAEDMRLGIENQWRFDWFADGRYETAIGADGQIRDNAGSFLTDNAIGEIETTQRPYRVTESNLGVYAQQIARFHPRVSMNVGARFDVFAYAMALSPRAALITNPWKDAELKLIYSQAFRAPGRVELEFNDEALKPEIVRGGELALQQRIGRHRLLFAGWGTFWDTIIQRTFESDPLNPGRQVVRQRNVNQIFGFGGSASYGAKFGNFDYVVQATYGYNRVRLGGLGGGDFNPTDDELLDLGFSRQAYDRFGRNQPLPAAPAVSGNLRLAYQWGEKGPSTAVVMSVTGPRIIDRVYNSANLLPLVDEGARTTVPTTVMGRFIVSGVIKELRRVEFGYRFAVDATSNVYTATAVGPFNFWQVGDGTRRLDLMQLPRLTVFGGIDVKFGGKAGRRDKESP